MTSTTSTAENLRYATEAQFFAIPEDERFHELLAGEIVQKAMPGFRHGQAQGSLVSVVRPYARPLSTPSTPGGWRFSTECEVRLFPDTVVRPDIAGWRRERLPRTVGHGPMTIAPDWICEVLSPSSGYRDLWDKMAIYHQAGVPHYWLLDPERKALQVHRWLERGYQNILHAHAHQTVRVEPFELLDIPIAELFDDEG